LVSNPDTYIEENGKSYRFTSQFTQKLFPKLKGDKEQIDGFRSSYLYQYENQNNSTNSHLQSHEQMDWATLWGSILKEYGLKHDVKLLDQTNANNSATKTVSQKLSFLMQIFSSRKARSLPVDNWQSAGVVNSAQISSSFLKFDAGDSTLYANPENSIRVFVDKNTGKTKEVYINYGNGVNVELNVKSEGIAFYRIYNNKEQLTHQYQLIAKSAWDENDQVFRLPKTWNAQDAKGNFIILNRSSWIYDDQGEIISYQSTSPLLSLDPNAPYAEIKYQNLQTELKNTANNLQNPNYEKYLANLKKQIDKNQEDPYSASTKLARTLVYRQGKLVKQNYFYYDGKLNLILIQRGLDPNILLVNNYTMDSVNAQFPEFILYREFSYDNTELEWQHFVTREGEIILSDDLMQELKSDQITQRGQLVASTTYNNSA
ncbi:MAG TPA: hypothetical protein PLQ36_03955, partial [Candidatus Gracilibacteria bacterium]|nr:hypothetical protein [Candidatus Gracilibacteria bacterium]